MQLRYLPPQLRQIRCFFHSVRYCIYYLHVGQRLRCGSFFFDYFFNYGFYWIDLGAYILYESMNIFFNFKGRSLDQTNGSYLMIFYQQSLSTSSISQTQISISSLKQYFFISLQKLLISAQSSFLKKAIFSFIYYPILDRFLCWIYSYSNRLFRVSAMSSSKKTFTSLITDYLLEFSEIMQDQASSFMALRSLHLFNLSSKAEETFVLISAALGKTSFRSYSCTLMFFGWFLVCSGRHALHSGSKCQTFPEQMKDIFSFSCFLQARFDSIIAPCLDLIQKGNICQIICKCIVNDEDQLKSSLLSKALIFSCNSAMAFFLSAISLLIISSVGSFLFFFSSSGLFLMPSSLISRRRLLIYLIRSTFSFMILMFSCLWISESFCRFFFSILMDFSRYFFWFLYYCSISLSILT